MKKTIKWAAALFLAVFVLAFIFRNGDSQATEKPTAPAQDTRTNKALAAIRKEKKVIEAIITEARVLYVSVANDGTRRDGLADYFCQVLSEHLVTGVRVKIVQAGTTKARNRDNAYGVLLGESSCKF